MKQATILFIMVILIAACSKTIKDSENPVLSAEETIQRKPSPPATANPALAYMKIFKVGNNRYPPGIFVIDENGTNETMVYANYSGQYTQWVTFPAWNQAGTKLCFTSDNADLFTLNISLVNGVPTGSGAMKIANGIAAGGQYKQGKWQPGSNMIASVWKKTGEVDKIHILPSGGGAASVLYAAADADRTIGDDISFNPEGSKLVFIERQELTDQNYLKVFDLNLNAVINTIDLSQFKSVFELDWGKTAGTNMVAILTVPRCDETPEGQEGMHQFYTIDVSSGSPLLTLRKTNAGRNISVSANDSKFTVLDNPSMYSCSPTTGCCTRTYNLYGFKAFSLITGAQLFSLTTNTSGPDWKR
jgi:hypothetical protein